MVLTGHDVGWYIERQRLVIRPITADQMQQNGIDLRLAETVVQIGMPGPALCFTHGQSHLGHTEEYLELPDDLMAFVQLRSTWARRGLLLPPTVVDAGFKGDLTLEIFCGGPDLAIPVGERFIHLVFLRLTGPAEPYNGKYQFQQGVTLAKPDPA